jgi:hypothetical protein
MPEPAGSLRPASTRCCHVLRWVLLWSSFRSRPQTVGPPVIELWPGR